MKFEIINITRGKKYLKIIIEYKSTGEREAFSFPFGHGYEEKDKEGNLKAVNKIKKVINRRKKKKAERIKSIKNIKEEYEGKEINL